MKTILISEGLALVMLAGGTAASARFRGPDATFKRGPDSEGQR